MSKGWIVIKFKEGEPSKRVAWFEEKEEAQDYAESMNDYWWPDAWYGWERDR